MADLLFCNEFFHVRILGSGILLGVLFAVIAVCVSVAVFVAVIVVTASAGFAALVRAAIVAIVFFCEAELFKLFFLTITILYVHFL